ncbi:hypothetical protein Tco_0642020 [Tanacetum coccineum]
MFVMLYRLPKVFLEAVPLPSGRGVTIYISPPTYLASAGLVVNGKRRRHGENIIGRGVSHMMPHSVKILKLDMRRMNAIEEETRIQEQPESPLKLLRSHSAHLTTFRARYYMEGVGSDSESGGRKTRERTAEVRHHPMIRDNVKEVMFYG